jgi:hypothetical protein
MRTKPSDITTTVARELVFVERTLRDSTARVIGRFHSEQGHRGNPGTCRRCLDEMRRRREVQIVITEPAAAENADA